MDHTLPALSEYQFCRRCGSTEPRHYVEFPAPRGLTTRTYECFQCGSRDIEQVTACMTCRKAEAVCDEECVACTVAFYTSNPDEFDVNDPHWVSSDFWIEAMNRIGLALSSPAPSSPSLQPAARSSDLGRMESAAVTGERAPITSEAA